MISMTGYGIQEYQDEQLILSVELKSYNNRYLDITMNMPGMLNPLEEELRTLLKGTARRGKLELYIRFRRMEQDTRVRLDAGLLQGYLSALQDARRLSAEGDVAVAADRLQAADLLSIEGLFSVESSRDVEELRKPLFDAVTAALQQWHAARVREGAATRDNIRAQMQRIQAAYQTVAKRAPELEQRIREMLHERFTELMGDQIDLQRVYAETAALLVKYSVNEELARLGAHIEEFLRLADSGGSIGKRMDFLCQEMHREMNTIGSKSALLEISRSVIDMKDALENIREQARNIE
ncbi:YicC/YloC family endoribonuclease [Spirochaeta africana]|uniref:TIGR00255 family protein n=1 Tax=Spirochaeta africana (strain ATCC 700263 / DSM 8902 / Z-7692) TaxID=889378 RepID=H9ULR5_SPIAZ|nr:YicC/YloC family endoribonuclease [Spirochaeta africana]AFG38458.1 TIGR00255 family protein [Spirochaeta africana DSM 8902]